MTNQIVTACTECFCEHNIDAPMQELSYIKEHMTPCRVASPRQHQIFKFYSTSQNESPPSRTFRTAELPAWCGGGVNSLLISRNITKYTEGFIPAFYENTWDSHTSRSFCNQAVRCLSDQSDSHCLYGVLL